MEFWRDEVFGQDGCQQLNKQAVSQLKISAKSRQCFAAALVATIFWRAHPMVVMSSQFLSDHFNLFQNFTQPCIYIYRGTFAWHQRERKRCWIDTNVLMCVNAHAQLMSELTDDRERWKNQFI